MHGVSLFNETQTRSFIFTFSMGICLENNIALSGLQTAQALFSVYCIHYCDVMIGAMASQITSLTITYSTIQ